MAGGPRSRIAGIICTAIIVAQVPLFAVKQNGTLVDSSPLQVIASQLVVTKGRSDIGRAILFPGALVKDGVHWALTNFGGDKSGKEPAKLADWDSILNSTSPLYNPEVLDAALTETFGEHKYFIVVGSFLLSVGSVLSIVYAAKMGIIGVGVVMWAVYKSEIRPHGELVLVLFLALYSLVHQTIKPRTSAVPDYMRAKGSAPAAIPTPKNAAEKKDS